MAAQLSREQQAQMNRTAQRYAAYLNRKFSVILGKKKFKNTGELQESLSVEIFQEAGLPAFRMRFALYGKVIDIKKVFWTALPPIDELTDWVKSKQAKFKYVPGYGGASPANQDEAARRIAWAIAKSKRLDFKHKQKKWKQGNIGNAIAYLSHLTAEHFAQFAADSLVKPLQR